MNGSQFTSIDLSTLETVVGSLGTTAFGSSILTSIPKDAKIDEMFACWCEKGGAPVKIASSGRVGSSIKRADLYATRFHRLDPLKKILVTVRDGDPTRRASIVARDIEDQAYRQRCFDQPGLREKICFMKTFGCQHFMLSFYRPVQEYGVRDVILDGFAELMFPFLRKHAELSGKYADLSLVERIESRLSQAFPLLTLRERQVCSRTAVGMSAEAASLDLGIGQRSVLTYRRRAYARYGISSASQFVSNLL